MRPVGRPPGPGKSGRLRGGPAVRTFGERGGVGKRASLMGGGRRNAACRGRTFRGRRPPGLRASARPRAPRPGLLARAVGIAAQARPSSAGKARLKQLLSPGLCPSCASSLPPLPPRLRLRV